MNQQRYTLTRARASIVASAIFEVCRFREWRLLALHVRSTHVHAIIAARVEWTWVIRDFKAYASRALNLVEEPRRRWARSGNGTRLLTDNDLRRAVRYVADQQGDPMAVYVEGAVTFSPS